MPDATAQLPETIPASLPGGATAFLPAAVVAILLDSISEADMIRTGTYTGNGADPRTISTGIPSTATLRAVYLSRLDVAEDFLKLDSHPAASVKRLTAGFSDNILTFSGTDFIVQTASTNQLGAEYYWMALASTD